MVKKKNNEIQKNNFPFSHEKEKIKIVQNGEIIYLSIHQKNGKAIE